MSTFRNAVALMGFSVLASVPVAAEPISYPFSTTVTQVFGPVQEVFGRTFVRGDALTGWVIIDPSSLGNDREPASHWGRFTVGAGRVVFDVPSGFSMDAAAIEQFDAIVENDAPPSDPFLDYARVDLWDQITVAPWIFNALQITWLDPTRQALSSAEWPTSVDQFRVTELRFNGYRGNTGSITLYGDSPAPVPEPATVSLLAAGLLATYARARRRRRRNFTKV